METSDLLAQKKAARAAGCPHTLGKWVLVSNRGSKTHRDGRERDVRLRGGRMAVAQYPCTGAAGHAGGHTTTDGRGWT